MSQSGNQIRCLYARKNNGSVQEVSVTLEITCIVLRVAVVIILDMAWSYPSSIVTQVIGIVKLKSVTNSTLVHDKIVVNVVVQRIKYATINVMICQSVRIN